MVLGELISISFMDFLTQSLCYLHHSLLEKQSKYAILRKSLKDLENRYEKALAPRILLENLEICTREKIYEIYRLKTLIKKKKEVIAAKSRHREKLKKENEVGKGNKLPMYLSNVNQMANRVSDRRVRIEIKEEERTKILDELKETAKEEIQQLVKYIFPVKKIKLKNEHSQVS